MGEVYDWNILATLNNSAPPDGAPENMEYEEVNDTMREMMAVVKRHITTIGGVKVTTGTQPAYVLTTDQTLSAYADGQLFAFTSHADSTGSVTLNVNGLGAGAVLDSRGNQLGSGDIKNGGFYLVRRTASNFRVLGHFASASVIATAGLTLTQAFLAGGTADAITLTTGLFTAYANGQLVAFRGNATNTGAMTINIDGLGAEALEDWRSAALAAGDVIANRIYIAGRTGGEWRILTSLPVDLANDVVGIAALANGGTGVNASSLANLRDQLGLEIGADVQAFDADLTTLAALSKTAGNLIAANGSAWTALAIGSEGTALRVVSGALSYASPLTLMAAVSASGTAVDFTSIPSWVRKVEVILNNVSLDGSDHLLVQIGDSGGIENTGYVATGDSLSSSSSSTSGFISQIGNASRAFTGKFSLVHIGSNLWIASFSGRVDTSISVYGGGSKTLTGTLDRVRVTPTGANSFDGGTVAVLYS